MNHCKECILIISILALTNALADTVTIMPIGDSGIEQHSPTNNLGGATEVVSGALGASAGFEIRRALFQFDLQGQIPAGSIINSVTLRVAVVFHLPQSPANSNFDLRRVLSSWTETEVTWNSRLSNVPWQIPGASGPMDSAGVASSSVFVSGLGNYTFPSTPAMVADVQAWVNDPTVSFGWLLVSEKETTPHTARHFATREDSVNSPRLVINFAPPSPPTIVTQPQSQTNFVGRTVVLSVTANGTPPPSYIWQFNGTPIPGGTDPTLVLNNVQTNDSGQYIVTVSNQSGQTNSQPATLTILPQPGLFVNITFPTNNALFPVGAGVLVMSQAGESNGTISQVEFFLNTNSVGVSTSSPFNLLLTNIPAGDYLLSAIATDLRQLTTTSSVLMVSFVRPPAVTLNLSPSDTNLPLGITITNTATVTTDRTKVTNVEFFADGTFLGSVTTPPFTNVWQPAEERLYSVTAVAMDEFGQAGTSAPVVIQVHLPDSIPPRIAITNAPPNFARLTSSTVELSGTASDTHRLDHVEYEVDSGPFLGNIGGSLPAQGTSNWLATNVTLLPGKNAVRFRSIDFAGNSSPVLTRFYTYVSKALLTVTKTGVGTVTPDLTQTELEIGQVYSVTARPGPGNIFAGWEGVPNTNSPRLSFEMTPGLSLVAHFLTNAFLRRAGSYWGVFYDTNAAVPESSGWFALQLAPSGAFTGKLSMNGARYPFRSRFDLNGSAFLPVLRKSLAPAVLALHLDLSGDTGQVTGFVTNAERTNIFVSELFAERNSFNARTNPAPQVLRLGFGLKRVSDQTIIGTTNWVSSSISGAVLVQINFDDGPRFVMRSALFQHGFEGRNLPLYFSLHRGSEAIVGLLHFDPDAMTGELGWSKTGTNGLSTQLEIVPLSK